MATKKASSSHIDVEDASQLSMLAYQVRTRRKSVPWARYVERLKSEKAKKIAFVILGHTEDQPDETVRQANYYLRWADATAKTAREASRRPGLRKR